VVKNGRRKRRPLRALGIMVASTLVALIAAELVLRMANLGPAPHPVSAGKVVRDSSDPVLRFEHRPNSARVRVFQQSRNDVPRIALYSIDQHGFRRPGVELQKPPGSFRIACLGDSFTFGTGLGDHETWPALLPGMLNEAQDGPTFEVMNCGVGGYNTIQEAAYLEQRVLRFEPDLVVCCLYLNDVMIGVKPPPAVVGERTRFVRRWTRPGRDDWMRSLRRASVLVDLVCDRLYHAIEASVYTQRHADVFTGDGEGWQLARDALLRMRAMTEQAGARFVLLLYPQMVRDGAVLSSHDAYAVVSEFARAEDIDSLDLESAFLSQPVEDFWVHPTDLHPNAAANEVAARAVAQFLLAGDLLSTASER
jgi:lysophospholipase L1-like esterase